MQIKSLFGNTVQTVFPKKLIFCLKLIFLMFSDRFDMVMPKIILKNIILIYF
jgi:hypothetical protein